MMDINPWQVESIQAFYYLKCPECEYNTTDEINFEDHAVGNHPLSRILFSEQIVKKGHFKEEFDNENVKEEPVSYPDEMENCTNFESSSTDLVPGPENYPEVLMTESYENKGFDITDDSFDNVYELDNEQFITDEQYQNSLKSDKSVKKPEKFVCNECGSLFKLQRSLKRHLEAKHWNLKSVQCDRCDFASARIDILKKHVQSVHEKLKPYNCRQCGKGFSSKQHCKEHEESIHDGITHSCDFCEMICKTKGHLRKHIKKVHNEIRVDIPS